MTKQVFITVLTALIILTGSSVLAAPFFYEGERDNLFFEVQEHGKRRGESPPQMEKFHERREEIRRELEALPEEERRVRIEEMRREFKERKRKARETARENLEERWAEATSEERDAFCNRVKEKCASEPPEEMRHDEMLAERHARVCALAAQKCMREK